MTLFERAKSFGVCYKRVHARHIALYESRKDISGMHPTFFENDMALALAMERIAELELRSELQPIETAPKDRVVDLLVNGCRVCDAWWSEEKQLWCHDPRNKGEDWEITEPVTHWMLWPKPVPTPRNKSNEATQ